MQTVDDAIRISDRTVRKRFGVSFAYNKRVPDGEQRRAWTNAKRQLLADLSVVLLPNRDYTIRYHEERRSGLSDRVECMVTADLTYTE